MSTTTCIGVDTSMVHTAVAWQQEDALGRREFVESLMRPTDGDLACARMIFNVRGAIIGHARPCVPLCVVATERLVGMRGASEKNVTLMWAVVEAATEAVAHLEEIGSPEERRVCILLPMPSQLKRFVTGAGNAEKAGMGRFIERHWPQAPEQEDEAEAYALMKMAECRRDFILGKISRTDTGPWTAYQVEAACKDLWSSAKASKLLVHDVTGKQALELANRFREGAWSGERLIEAPAEVAAE